MGRRSKKKNPADICRKDNEREAPGTSLDSRKPCKDWNDWTAEQQLSAIRAEAARVYDESSDEELDLSTVKVQKSTVDTVERLLLPPGSALQSKRKR